MYVPSGSAAKKQKKPWKFYSNMKFLRDVMAPRSTISNLNLDSPPSSCSSQEMAVPSKLNKGKGTNQIENAILTAIENLPVPKVSRADVGTKVNPICQQLSTILEQLPSRKKAKLEIEFLTKAYEVLHEEDK
ncbi:hypothetical protein RI129_002191 [Pyrocoelia pectoralis]|uniref:BESS domain-containing protein n=1 Tax=Pyrocoelia pectoralis TaxID=417401 RepID=A0AAN7VP39_9COLE